MAEETTGAAARIGHVAKRTLGVAQSGLTKLQKKRFDRTPAGHAQAAYLRGDTVFQHREKMTTDGHGEVLSSIEAEGWTLEDTQITSESKETTDAEGNTESVTTNHAVYLFRRTEPDADGEISEP